MLQNPSDHLSLVACASEGGKGVQAPWVLKFEIFLINFSKKHFSLSFEWVNWNFTFFGPLENLFGYLWKKSTFFPRKESLRCPWLVACQGNAETNKRQKQKIPTRLQGKDSCVHVTWVFPGKCYSLSGDLPRTQYPEPENHFDRFACCASASIFVAKAMKSSTKIPVRSEYSFAAQSWAYFNIWVAFLFHSSHSQDQLNRFRCFGSSITCWSYWSRRLVPKLIKRCVVLCKISLHPRNY